MAGDDIIDGHAEAGERRIFIVVNLGLVRGLPQRETRDEDSSKKFRILFVILSSETRVSEGFGTARR